MRNGSYRRPRASGPIASGSDSDPETQSGAAAAAGDSISVASWTIISRVTGVAKFVAIGAVLGPTFFGNTYQFTNSLPNLVYYGFLAGSLFSSLLVPALVRHIDAKDRPASERVAGGFLGMTLVLLLAVTPLAIVLGPLVLKFAALGGHQIVGTAQERIGRLLIMMFIPQVFFYGVVGTATAVMNARRRFALAAAAPALENIGTIAVLGATAVLFRADTNLNTVRSGEMLLLGLGTTGAVALHAATQWWGAKRAGVVLVPRLGWRDPEVRVIVRRALPSLAQAGLVAVQVLTLLIIANRVAGGVVAFQIALNFYYLAIAIGATPVALSLLPRLSRMHMDGEVTLLRDTLVRGFALGFFVAIPAAVGYLTLAVPIARAVSFGKMGTHAGVSMVALSLAGLAVAVVGQTAFMIATYASYAMKDTRSPLKSMLLQAFTCLGLVSAAFFVRGPAMLAALGLALSVSIVVSASHLTTRLWRRLRRGSERLTPSLIKVAIGAMVMAIPAWLTATTVPRWIGPPLGPRLGILAAALVGGAVFLAFQALLGTPEMSWITGGLGHLRGKTRRAAAEVSMASGGLLRSASGRVAGICPPLPPGLEWRARWVAGQESRWLLVPLLIGASGVGAIAALSPVAALPAGIALALMACVWARPAVAAYLIIGLTPLTAGINRGSALPVLRPNEALALVAGTALAARGIVGLRTGQLPRLRLGRVATSIVLMALASSVVPMLWMLARQQPITRDDLLYAFVLWKYLGIYFIIRSSITTDQQVRRCLWLSVTAASIVAVLAILQSLGLFGVSHILATYYAPFGNTNAFQARGSSTLGLPAATADLLIFNLAIVSGLWMRFRRYRGVLAAASALYVIGALSAGEFSSAIGLVLGVVCIAIVTNTPRLLALFVPAGLVAFEALRPVISRRLSGFQSVSGLPVSWTGRLQNLRSYFWPKLFSDWNFLFGVRPSARVPVATQATGYVWIESGYTWLLWGGGIPLLLSFLYFVQTAVKTGWVAARRSGDATSVAGIAVFVAVIVTTVLMTFDPHLTYRGSADLLFALLALAESRHKDHGGESSVVHDERVEHDAPGFAMEVGV